MYVCYFENMYFIYSVAEHTAVAVPPIMHHGLCTALFKLNIKPADSAFCRNPFIIKGITVFCSRSVIFSLNDIINVNESIFVQPVAYTSLKTFAHVILPENNFILSNSDYVR